MIAESVTEKMRKKLEKLLDIDPELKSILMSGDPVEKKRERIRAALSIRMDGIYDDDTHIPPLRWILARDCTQALTTMLSTRSERLIGFSLLGYLNDLLHKDDPSELQVPSQGFMVEMEHLLKGLTGRAKIYEESMPAFAKYEGEKAARLRSDDLSRMGAKAEQFLRRYPGGLDKSIQKKRILNKTRILKFFNATDIEWENWKWHTRHIIRDADTLAELVKLSHDEYEAVKLARDNKIPFGITPYYLSLMDRDPSAGMDTAVRAQVIPSLHYIRKLAELKNQSEISMDFMMERDTSPMEGVTRRYPMICILKPVLTCPQICVYCQRNWEIEDVYSSKAVLSKAKVGEAIKWIAANPQMTEVLVTGGDPFILSDDRLENLLFRLSRIKHVKRIRLGTRTPVTLPQRITESLVRDIIHFHIPGKREITIITHFEHPYEITPQAMEAVQKFRRYGVEVYNQLVYTFYNSRKFEAVALRQMLRMIGVTPYYTFNTKGKEETDEYRVPIPRLLQEQQEEARLMPGTLRTDEIVFNVPRLGKNYLRAGQNRDLISILPDGRRVYEFHPWEKKLALADTYLYTDVPIYDYMRRLRAAGEDTHHYRTIWYYY